MVVLLNTALESEKKEKQKNERVKTKMKAQHYISLANHHYLFFLSVCFGYEQHSLTAAAATAADDDYDDGEDDHQQQ